jgi:prepilin-type N-terminal cleavage/methylation domain-containing protein
MIHNEKGLTLLEVLAAMTILSLAIMMFLNISGYSTQSNRKDSFRMEAIRLAEKTMNEKRDSYESSVPVFTDPVWASPQVSTEGKYTVTIQQTGMNASSYNRASFKKNSVSVQSVIIFKDSAQATTIIPRLVTVTVSWEG